MLFAKIETHFKWREQFFNWNSMCFSLTDFFLFEWGPTREFFTHKETSPLPEKGYKFWRMLGTNDHFSVRFFNLSLLLWHGASIYNGHLRGPVTLTPNAEFLAVWQWSCHYLFLRLRSVAAGIRTSNLPLAGPTLIPTAPPQRFVNW